MANPIPPPRYTPHGCQSIKQVSFDAIASRTLKAKCVAYARLSGSVPGSMRVPGRVGPRSTPFRSTNVGRVGRAWPPRSRASSDPLRLSLLLQRLINAEDGPRKIQKNRTFSWRRRMGLFPIWADVPVGNPTSRTNCVRACVCGVYVDLFCLDMPFLSDPTSLGPFFGFEAFPES